MARKRSSNQLVRTTTNSSVYRKAKRDLDLDCSLCPPHRNENAGRRSQRGARKPKKKDHR